VSHHPFDSFRSRVRHARQCGDLYFASLISKETIESVFGKATSVLGAARIYNTSVTLWVFLSQVMSIHHGCVSAVAKLITYRVANKGFRTREIIVHTSLWDDTDSTKEDIAALFRRRWQAELNLRSLKTIMQMEHLRCHEPHRVRNEIRTQMLAYNLVRGVMAEAAIEGNVQPWQISFKSTLTTISDMLPVLGLIRHADELCDVLLRCCAQHAVGNRPDRYEPRVLKRRPKNYKLMQKPRSE
jgi:IS4 transposase